MDRDIERMVENSGVSVPLAARIVSLILDSGASGVEVSIALTIVRSVLHALPLQHVAESVGASAFHEPESEA